MPPADPVALVQHVHGPLGWLAAAALVHPALLLRRPARRVRLAAASAVGLTTLAVSLGIWLYGPYRARIKRTIFLTMEPLGWMFERKEHLAFGALALAWVGLLVHLAEPLAPREVRESLRRGAHRAFAGAAALALLTAVLGTSVAVLGPTLAPH